MCNQSLEFNKICTQKINNSNIWYKHSPCKFWAVFGEAAAKYQLVQLNVVEYQQSRELWKIE